MKKETVVLGIVMMLVFTAGMLTTRVEGDNCTPGIKKEHLDSTPGNFVDNSTLEIGSTGVRVKDGGITNSKIAVGAITSTNIAVGAITSVFGNWVVTDSTNQTLVKEVAYSVTSDGFVIGWGTGNPLSVETPAGTTRYNSAVSYPNDQRGFCVPVKSGSTWKVRTNDDSTHTYLVTICWLPVGNGACIKPH